MLSGGKSGMTSRSLAALALRDTASLWLSDEARRRSLGLAYRAHFKILSLTVADFLRMVGAGLDPLEWLTSIGLLGAFHDPDQDSPPEEIRSATREKTARMLEQEQAWMAAMLNERLD
jgi:hypothetical protein